MSNSNTIPNRARRSLAEQILAAAFPARIKSTNPQRSIVLYEKRISHILNDIYAMRKLKTETKLNKLKRQQYITHLLRCRCPFFSLLRDIFHAYLTNFIRSELTNIIPTPPSTQRCLDLKELSKRTKFTMM